MTLSSLKIEFILNVPVTVQLQVLLAIQPHIFYVTLVSASALANTVMGAWIVSTEVMK
jgi:hypothetical protein